MNLVIFPLLNFFSSTALISKNENIPFELARSFWFMQPRSLLAFIAIATMTSPIRSLVQNYISQNNVMMFAKSYCPYCNKAKDLFNSLKVPFNYVDLDTMENGTAIQSDLTELTGQKTVPNIFIKGKHIGGCDKVHQLNSEGKLLEMI